MKCAVIYFSQTGNTEKVARAIQAGIKQVAGNCDLLRIQDADPLRLSEYDLIGLGAPVIGEHPANVGTFVSRMRFVGGKHAFIFYTHGTLPEMFLPTLYPKLTNRGLIVIGSADWYGDCYLLHMPVPYPTAGHPDEIDLQQAEEFGREMVLRSWKISAGETDLIPPPPAPAELSPLTLKLDSSQIPTPPPGEAPANPKSHVVSTFSRKLKFHKEKCLYPKCTLCMDNCPMYGMDLSVDPPVLAKPCLACEFCARICPTGALDMDEWVEDMIALTKPMRRVILGCLDKAEAEGRFRRLIPIDKLNLEVFGVELHKKHPQWIIGKGPQ